MARTADKDYVVDLGAGDGRIVIAAAKEFGARATGIEYDARLAASAQSGIPAGGAFRPARSSSRATFSTPTSAMPRC